MALVDMNTLVGIAKKDGVMLPAFNTTNLETTLGIMDGLEKAKLPGIVQIAPTNVKLSGYDYMATITMMAEKHYTVPMALHLDHGKSLDDVREAVHAGFTSIMIDGAALPFEENIRYSRQAVDFCHCYGIPVEAELGAIRGKEDDHVSEADLKTDPKQVKEYVERVGCDLLAVSVGNVHGLEDTPRIDLPLLGRISEVSPCPLVLHGGSGINNQCILDGIANGIAKINVGTEIRQTYERTLGETNDVEKARAAVYTRTCEIIRSFRIEGNQEKLFG